MKEIIDRIKNASNSFEGFNMMSIPGFDSYLIGIDQNQNIVFMIQPNKDSDVKSVNSSRGRYLDIFYDMECQISTNGEILSDSFTILNLKTTNGFFEKIFYSICNDLITLLGNSPDHHDVVNFVESLRDLFRKTLNKASKTEIGLWGELFIIENSTNVELLIDSWHNISNQTFDFNDGESKLEVKTTTRGERVHSIKLNQLSKAQESNSLICSIMTSEIELGKSVSDLFESISLRVKSDYRIKLLEKIMDVAGDDLNNYTITFDYKTAIQSMSLYSATEIPSINSNFISNAISNVKFDVSLENIDKYLNHEEDSGLISSII